MLKEIGSDFWEVDLKNKKESIFKNSYQLLLSGRTAIDFIIKDIKLSHNFSSIYMPSYCCHSMVQPFLDNQISVEFYDVDFRNGRFTYDIDFKNKCNVIFLMQYFGFCNNSVQEIVFELKKWGKIIIEDATHSWLSDNPYCKNSDYVFISYRKWTGIPCGAVAIKKNSHFQETKPLRVNNKYVRLRQQAIKAKKQFINDGIGKKEDYLTLFYQSEKILDFDYQNYKLPKNIEQTILKLDLIKMMLIRKENCSYLIEGLNNCKNVECIKMDKKDTPLFLPIIIKNGERDKLQQVLIKEDIYCPIHWPLTKYHSIKNKNLYNTCLSLVCDQRYSISHMDKIIFVIQNYFGK
jgi:hypothetical protein